MLKINKVIAETKSKILYQSENIIFKDGFKYLITGENGVGKSTFLKSLLNLSELVEMDFNYDGKIIYQDQDSFFYKRTPSDNFKLFGIKEKRIKDQIERLNIKNLLNRSIDTLSGGERQKFIFLRSINIKSDILLLDEPFSKLDKKSKMICFEILNEIILENPKKIIIMVSHDDPNYDFFDYHLKFEKQSIKMMKI
ncbi:MAG: ATP-binding cassette domain-containing protein [Tissierellia bacterium]|nr:ATP-binding cassette domain-containing protein [Tissierellia bacterium]